MKNMIIFSGNMRFIYQGSPPWLRLPSEQLGGKSRVKVTGGEHQAHKCPSNKVKLSSGVKTWHLITGPFYSFMDMLCYIVVTHRKSNIYVG